MRIAFKEWTVVVDQLGRGEQILILRKGGIAEGRDGFQLEHPEFLLFPTLFHQQRDAVVEAAQARYDELVPLLPAGDVVRLEYFATVAACRRLECLSEAEALRGQHCWRDEVIAARFDWGSARNIFAVALRVHRLPLPVELPALPSYGGCRSWVELDREVPTAGGRPVLDPTAFDRKLQRFLAALNPAAMEDASYVSGGAPPSPALGGIDQPAHFEIPEPSVRPGTADLLSAVTPSRAAAASDERTARLEDSTAPLRSGFAAPATGARRAPTTGGAPAPGDGGTPPTSSDAPA